MYNVKLIMFFVSCFQVSVFQSATNIHICKERRWVQIFGKIILHSINVIGGPF